MKKLIALLTLVGVLAVAGCPEDNPAGDAWKTGGETGTVDGGGGAAAEGDTTAEESTEGGM